MKAEPKWILMVAVLALDLAPIFNLKLLISPDASNGNTSSSYSWQLLGMEL
jgi:hypothetical protein